MSPTKLQTRSKYHFRISEPLTSRIRHSVLTMTHVVVGDHDPEPRANTSREYAERDVDYGASRRVV